MARCRFPEALIVFLLLGARAAGAEGTGASVLAKAGVRGGLVVHLGCGDGKLTASLLGNESYAVHGLDVDAKNVERARRHIRSLGLYGKVSMDTFDGTHLPYVDSLVNLLVADSRGKVPADEVMRVLAPRGVAIVGGKRSVKPWPAEIDEWTHYLHGPGNNAVARDSQVGPPRRLKWVCGPPWARSHEFLSSLCAMVSANGRLFYIFDEGLTSITDAPIPEKWKLIARDAFNGMLLWKRPLSDWGARPWRTRALRNTPKMVPRRLVAAGDRVFVTLGHESPVSVLDAASGETLATYKGTGPAQEMRYLEGVLLVRKAGTSLVAIDTKTGKELWQAKGKIQPQLLAAHEGKVFYQDAQNLSCLRLVDGGKLWRVKQNGRPSLLVAHDDFVLLALGGQIRALSAATGQAVWTVKGRVARGQLFVADGRIYVPEGRSIVARDLRTGGVKKRIDPSEVFTPGHHPRCYPSKATEKFVITPNRGIEFVSLTGEAHTQNDWVRGPCVYGIMPCNGLLYVPPDPCFCYPGVKITGFNALAGAGAMRDPGYEMRDRLEKGPAFGTCEGRGRAAGGDWPTYRHDSARKGSAGTSVPADLKQSWKVELGGRLTPAVVAGGRVYVASKDAHALHVLDEKSGREIWSHTAGGRVDSPPTVCGDLVLFGCADGRVYCLRESDGEMVWRFRAAPTDRLIMASGQLESPWRVHGSVLVEKEVAYFTAGRSTYLDGGIRVYGLDPKTGEVLHETRLDTWARTRKDAEGKPFIPGYHMEGAQSDILVSEGGSIFLGQVKLDLSLRAQEAPYVLPDPDNKTVAMDLMNEPFVESMKAQKKYENVQRQWQWRTQRKMMENYQRKYGGANLGDRKMGLRVFATGGFLDDAWYNRTFWMYSRTWPGFYLAHRGAKTGQLLSVDEDKTYAVQAFPSRNLQSPLFTPGKKGYLLFADDNDNEPVMSDYTRGVPKGIGFTRKRPPAWFKWVPVRVRAMVAANDALFVAGPPDVLDPGDPMASFEGRAGAVLWAVAKQSGEKVSEYKLDSPPVFDGMVAANERLYLTTVGGEVVCLGKR